MPVAFRSAAYSETAAAGAALTLTAPSDIEDDDILIAAGNARHGDTSSMTVTGFTNILSWNHTGGAPGGSILYRRASAESGDYAASFVGAASALDRGGWIVAISGAVTSGSPIHASGISSEGSETTNSVATLPPDVTVTIASLILRYGFAQAAAGGFTGAAITGVTATERVDDGELIYHHHGVYTDDTVALTDPGSATITLTNSSSSASRFFGVTLAIEEAAPPLAEGSIIVPDMRSINFFTYRGSPPGTGRPVHK